MADKLTTYGMPDGSNVSQYLRAWIIQNGVAVCGIIGPGTSRSLSAKWDAPMEQANAGNSAGSAADTTQAATGTTTITAFSSTQIWQGNMPIKFSLNLIFIAMSDAEKEVMMPLQKLEEFASGRIKDLSPVDFSSMYAQGKALVTGGTSDQQVLGRIPGRVSIDIGRKSFFPECVIENITIPLDKERDSKGNLIRAEVQLDIQTLKMISKEDISASWNGVGPAKSPDKSASGAGTAAGASAGNVIGNKK